MPQGSLLDPILEFYTFFKNAETFVVKEASQANKTGIISKSLGSAFSPVDFGDILTSSGLYVDELEDLAILALWARFEKYLRSYFQSKTSCIAALRPTVICSNINSQLNKEIEYWKMNDILDVLKDANNGVDPNLIGQAKQIKQYRDWVAHGRPSKKSYSASVTLQNSYITLSAIIKEIELLEETS